MDKKNEAKPWRCESGHTLGIVIRNGRGITQLLLYREAVDLIADEPGETDVIAVVEGLAMDVRCNLCGAVRTWVPGEAALRRMLARAKHTIEEA